MRSDWICETQLWLILCWLKWISSHRCTTTCIDSMRVTSVMIPCICVTHDSCSTENWTSNRKAEQMSSEVAKRGAQDESALVPTVKRPRHEDDVQLAVCHQLNDLCPDSWVTFCCHRVLPEPRTSRRRLCSWLVIREKFSPVNSIQKVTSLHLEDMTDNYSTGTHMASVKTSPLFPHIKQPF